MNTLIGDQLSDFVVVIEQAGVPALRVGFTVAVIVFLLGGVFIFRRRHQLAIQTLIITSLPSATTGWRKSFLFGAA
jgi:hypothetical protein